MKKMYSISNYFVALMLLFTVSSFGQTKNIVETAVSSEDFSTLVTAVKAADLVDVLSGEGPFTVFAPTNAAFAKLPDGTIASLLQPENKSTLKSILTYHVVSGNFKANDVINLIKDNDGMAEIKTVNGEIITAQIKEGHVYLVDGNGNSSKVTSTDLNQSNGVIHVIDSVVLPK